MKRIIAIGMIILGLLIIFYYFGPTNNPIQNNSMSIVIPSVGINQPVNTEGIDKGVFYKQGVLFGHRTTHGAPFLQLDSIKIGDFVYFNDTTYKVVEKRLVDPDYILQPVNNHLYLSTCTLDASQRILIDTIKEENE